MLRQLFVFRMPYRFPGGPGNVSGISFVVTRLDAGRKGIARSLLEEAHRRERAAGQRHSTLWTSRAWAAHRIYERLGYRDLYEVRWAFRERTSDRPLPPGYRTQPVRTSDLRQLERFHQTVSRDRWGFTPRTKASFRADLGARELELSNFVLLRRGEEWIGYAIREKVPGGITCGELLGATDEDERLLIRAVEREAGGGFNAFAFTPLTQRLRWFAARGYTISPGGYQVWMGTRFDRRESVDQARREFGSQDRRFLCMSHDRF